MELTVNGINSLDSKEEILSIKKVKFWKFKVAKMLKAKMYILEIIMDRSTRNGRSNTLMQHLLNQRED